MNGYYFLIPLLLIISGIFFLPIPDASAEEITQEVPWKFRVYLNDTDYSSGKLGLNVTSTTPNDTPCSDYESGNFIDQYDWVDGGVTAYNQQLHVGAKNSTDGCTWIINSWNFDSVPDDMVISNVTFGFDMFDEFGNGGNCDYRTLPTRGWPANPPFGSAFSWVSMLYEDAHTYVFANNDPTCNTGFAGNTTGLVVDLGTYGIQFFTTAATYSDPAPFGMTISNSFQNRNDNFTHNQIFYNQYLEVTVERPPDPPKLTGSVIDNSVGMDVNWDASDVESYSVALDHYEVERYNGATWNTFYSSGGINVTDTSPTANPTAMYRISGEGTVVPSLCSAHFLPQSLVESLVGYWSGCGTLVDSGLHDQDVSLTNGTESYTSLYNDLWFDFGESSGAGTNATTNNHFLPVYSQMQFNNTDAYSMAGWFITTNGTDGRVQNIYSLGSTNEKTKFKIATDGSIEFLIRGNATSKTVTSPLTTYADNLPHFLVGTHSGNADLDGMNLYIDGQWIVGGTSDPFTETTIPTGYVSLGGQKIELSNSLDGYGKDFMIFNKEITAHEIELLYNEQVDSLFTITEGITSLNATVIDLDTVRLDFDTVATSGVLPLACYQINYTTPQGDPQTIATSCVAPSTSIAVNNLNTFDNEYSFRMGTSNMAIINVTSLIANTTSFELFTIGNITTPSGDNPTTVDIEFIEYDYTNRTDVQVRYNEFLDLECDVGFKFARTNVTYGNLTETMVGGGLVYTNFTFNDPDNEIITMQCNDVSDTTIDGTYLITQTSMPLLTQVQNFQGGLYGTDGKFGVLDLITLFVVLISMIGFNRYNPALGVIVMVMGMGSMSYFGFIQWESTLMGIIALIVVLAVIQVRKQ